MHNERFPHMKNNVRPDKDVTKYPMATIALYGPTDKRTTKVVVAVFKGEDSEPILRQWVSSSVTTDPKITRQITQFMKDHNVKQTVATAGNIGCPHEEEKDFPLGSDCPFCPFWKGKQGSGNSRSM